MDLKGFIKSSATLPPKTKTTVRTVTTRPNVLTSQSSKSNSPNATIYNVSPMEPGKMYDMIKESTVFTSMKGNPDIDTTITKTKEEPATTTEDKSVLTTTDQETSRTSASKTTGNNATATFFRDVSVVTTESTSAMTKLITTAQSTTVTEKPTTYTTDMTTTATSKTTKNSLAGCKSLLVPFPNSYGFGIKPESYLQFSVNKGSLQTRYVLS